MKILKLTVFLAVVSALAGGVLAFVNDLTAPIIEAQSMAAETASLAVIFPGSEFEPIENFDDATGSVKGAYIAKGEGYVFRAEAIGYNSSSPISFMLGIDNDGNIVGYEVLAQQETNGLGSKITEDDYKNGLVGKTVNDSVDMISGATVTSTAMANSINAIKEVYASVAGVEVNTEAPVVAKPTYTLADDYSTNAATLVSASEGVYTVEAVGFHGVNTFVVTVADGAVVSVEMTGFNDTPGIGDTVGADYFATLIGATASSEVDVVSGATFTSKAALAAVQLALNSTGEVEGTTETEETTEPETEEVAGPIYEGENATITAEADGVYTVEAMGFHGTNVFEIKITDNKVESVVMTGFNDTPGIGDLVNDEYLAKYVGVEEAGAVNVVSGATFTSRSAQAAIQTALDYAANK